MLPANPAISTVAAVDDLTPRSMISGKRRRAGPSRVHKPKRAHAQCFVFSALKRFGLSWPKRPVSARTNNKERHPRELGKHANLPLPLLTPPLPSFALLQIRRSGPEARIIDPANWADLADWGCLRLPY